MTKDNEFVRVFVFHEGGTYGVKNITDSLGVIHDIIECDCVDMPTRYVGGRPYVFICDDSGLLRERDVTAVGPCIGGQFPIRLVGTLIVCRTDSFGNLVDLSDADIRILIDSVQIIGPFTVMTDVLFRGELA